MPATALGAVFDKLTEQVKRVKTRRREAPRRRMARGVATPPGRPPRPPAEAAGDGRPRVIRSRRFVAKPMTLDEAALLVGGNGDGVLVFRDAATRADQRALPAPGRQPRPHRTGSVTREGRPRPKAAGLASAGRKTARGTALPADRRGEARDGPSVPVRALLEAGAGRTAAEAGRRPRRARPPDHPRPRAAARPRPHRVHRLHPLRPRADHGRQRAQLPRRLPPARRAAAIARLARCRISCFVVTKGQRPPAELLAEAEARGDPGPGDARGVDAVHQGAVRVPRGAAGPAAAPPFRAPRRLRARRPDRGRERDRQVGVRARPHRPRAPADRRRRDRDQAHRGHPDRRLART